MEKGGEQRDHRDNLADGKTLNGQNAENRLVLTWGDVAEGQFHRVRRDDEKNQQLHPYLDPKCHWALRHPELFPVEVNRASFDELLRVPGIGTESAYRIVRARKMCSLTWDGVKNIGVVLKRARYFLLCKGRSYPFLSRNRNEFLLAMMSPRERALFHRQERNWFQPTLFNDFEDSAGRAEMIDLKKDRNLWLSAPVLSDRQKEALLCVRIPVFG